MLSTTGTSSFLRAPPFSTIPLLRLNTCNYHRRRHSSSRSLSSNLQHFAADSRHFYSRRFSFLAPSSMAGDDSVPGDHRTGDWYSVPDLRLRDHRFMVPLDYRSNTSVSRKISIFARELVSGDMSRKSEKKLWCVCFWSQYAISLTDDCGPTII